MSDTKDWFNESRYGMFVHWGPYSVAGRGEWIMNRERISKEEYTKECIDTWHAENYDPKIWTDLAKKNGMKYMVLTTRHHDGFSLWDSKVNEWNSVNYGPKQDLVASYVEAVREAGLKVGLYYSPASWTHPDYPGAYYRDWPGEDDWKDEESRQRFIEYYRAELIELVTNYGKIDYLWFDGCIPGNIDGDETLRLIKEIQPDILVNNRLGEPFDIKCSEQTIKAAPVGQNWEACMTLNDNWGYHAGDTRWKDSVDVINMVLTCAQDGGNLLLNIGPYGDGTIPVESVQIMEKAGEWINANEEVFRNSDRHPFSWNCTARPITAKDNKVYLHFIHDPKGAFCWSETANKVLSAKILSTGTPISFEQKDERLFLSDIPSPLPDELVTTIVLELDGKPEALMEQTTFWIPE